MLRFLFGSHAFFASIRANSPTLWAQTVALGGGWQCKPHDESLAMFFLQGRGAPARAPLQAPYPCVKTCCVFYSVRTPYSPPFGQTRPPCGLRQLPSVEAGSANLMTKASQCFSCRGVVPAGLGSAPGCDIQPPEMTECSSIGPSEKRRYLAHVLCALMYRYAFPERKRVR